MNIPAHQGEEQFFVLLTPSCTQYTTFAALLITTLPGLMPRRMRASPQCDRDRA